MVALLGRSNPNSGPRELFSISQIEKAFGAAYMPAGAEGCVRAWGERYLTGLKEPEFTYEQALALPERTQDEKKERSSYIAKSFGKALEARADEWFETGTARFDDEPGKRLFPGLHLLPHPTQLDHLQAASGAWAHGYQKQIPVSVKLFARESPEAISFRGFKDAIFTVNGARFLVDYKTTKPKVDNRKNAELGKPAGWWTWMKTPEQLLGDYQWNLYQWDEYAKTERFLQSRWVYFASQETPQARAVDVQLKDIDPERVKSVCTQLADRANVLRGYIRGWRKAREQGAIALINFTDALPKNVTNCNAFGRLCPYHKRSPGGTCAGGDDQVVPVGQLLSAPNSRPIKSVSVGVFEPGAFQFTSNSPIGANTDMSIRDTINQQLAQQAQAPQGPSPAPWTPPAGAAPAPQGFVPQGQPPQGAPPFQGGHPAITQPFAPAPGQPGFAGPPPHVGPPEYQQAPPQAAPLAQTGFPPQAPAAAPAPVVAQPTLAAARPAPPAGFGRQQGNPDYWSSGQGGWLDQANYASACEYYGVPVGFGMAAVQTSPIPAVAQASAAPLTSTDALAGTQPEQEPEDEGADLAAIGALTVALFQAVLGVLGYGKNSAPGEAPKRKAGRPKKTQA